MITHIKYRINKILHKAKTEVEDEQYLSELLDAKNKLTPYILDNNSTEYYQAVCILKMMDDVGLDEV